MAVILQASLTFDLWLQKLALRLELYEAAADQEHSKSSISFYSHFQNTCP